MSESRIALGGFMALFALFALFGIVGVWFYAGGGDSLGVFFAGFALVGGVWGMLDTATRFVWRRVVITSAGIQGSRVGHLKLRLPWTLLGEATFQLKFGVAVVSFGRETSKAHVRTLYLSEDGAAVLGRALEEHGVRCVHIGSSAGGRR